MSRDRRDKASDLHRTSSNPFAQQVNFARAFPDLESLKVEVTESGASSGLGWGEERTRSEPAILR